MTIEIVPIAAVPTGELLDLLRTCLGEAAFERDETFWRWKHEANPFGVSPGLVALAGTRPVALRTFMRWRWRAGGETVEAVRAVDTVTHPEWRRRGIFQRLTRKLCEQCAERGIRLVFNTPNSVSRRGYLALGWSDVGRLPLLVHPRRPAQLLAAAFGHRRTGPDEPAVDQPPELRPVAELLALPVLAGWLAGSSGDGQGDPRWRTDRSSAYLRWRYADAPGLDYRSLWRVEGDGGAAVIVRLRRRRGLLEMAVVEWIASAGASGEAASRWVAARIAKVLIFDHAVAIAAPGTPQRNRLREVGFLPASALGPRLTVRSLHPWPGGTISPPDPRHIAAWRLSAGDVELF